MYIFANWKMYLDFDESCILMSQLMAENFDIDAQLGIFPSTLAFSEIEKLARDTQWGIGAQNVAWVEKGAYTGAVSAHLFKEVGAQYAMVGHSERRHIFGEKNEDTQKKMQACLDVGLVPVLCIGETQEDKENDKRQYRLKRQLHEALQGLDLQEESFLVAYEPVWAIGSGTPCTDTDAEDVAGWIKSELKDTFNLANIAVLYGGSVDSKNVLSYTTQPSIDGVLVGGASAKFDTFSALIRAVAKG
ncbi:triose-phosphate isomerase [Candidatus Nomurabacteria bacterium]|nr:triose-phosphate isomerase [Candidatus Nomurabacteria bacterium]